MKRKLKMKKNLKYIILGVLDSIFIINLPSILINATTLNQYRYNWIMLGIFLIANFITITFIENK